MLRSLPVQWKVNGHSIKTEASVPSSHWPFRFGASIYSTQSPAILGVEWLTNANWPTWPTLDSTIQASGNSLSKTSGATNWGDYAFSDYDMTSASG